MVSRLMEALVYQRKKLVLTSVKQGQNFGWVSITIVMIVICWVMEKKSLSLKPIIKIVNFPTQICLGSISNGFGATELILEMCVVFHAVTMLLISLIYLKFTSF